MKMSDDLTIKGKKNYTILIVDDEEDVQNALKMTIERSKLFDCKIFVANNGKEALTKLESEEFDLVLSDFRMPVMDGIEFLDRVREKYPDTIRILITGNSEMDIAKKAISKAKVHNYIEKPWDREELIKIINDELMVQTKKSSAVNNNICNIDNVKNALNQLIIINNEIQTNPTVLVDKELLTFEFDSSDEFNKFNHEVKKMSNLIIEGVYMFENKYKVTIGIYQESCKKIL
jgi:YesN/AraC family two-component response regulator